MWWVVPLMVFGHFQFFGVESHAVPQEVDSILSSSSDFQKNLHVARALRHTYTSDIGTHSINSQASTWKEARQLCKEQKGHLAVINSVDESRVVAELLITASHSQKWSSDSIQAFIGIHDLYQDGDFTTIYDESLAEAGYNEWFVNNTATADGDERCGAIGEDGKLYKVKCDSTHAFVCEWPDNGKRGHITIVTAGDDLSTTSISAFTDTNETTSSNVVKEDSYIWVTEEFSECSTACGGGIKSRLVRCVRRGDGEEGDAELCDPEFEPQGTQSCGDEPCPPKWDIGEWGPCSKKCGSGGKQTREIKCKQLISRNINSTVDDSQCLEYIGPKDIEIQECNEGVECPQWHIGPWKPCDRLCGAGNQTREITCYKKVNGKISVMDDSECPEQRPESESDCNLRPCVGVDWFVSAWSGCDVMCGLTHQTRTVTCMSLDGEIYPDEQCDPETKPELVMECSANEICAFQWYATQWSECSSKCGLGIQARKVFCGTSLSGSDCLNLVDDEKCAADKKYNSTQECNVEAEDCKGEWLAGTWSECSKECGGGEKKRKVFCMKDDKVVPDKGCDQENFMPLSESCNEKPCNDDETIPDLGISDIPEDDLVTPVPVKVNVSVDPGPFPVGSEFSIACDVEGFPDPTVTWYKDDNLLKSDNRISFNDGANRLAVSNVVKSDAGSYRCEAANQYSKDAKYVGITVEGIYIHPDCKDSEYFANCAVIAKGKYCGHDYYAKFCCRSCTAAGELPARPPHINDARRKRRSLLTFL